MISTFWTPSSCQKGPKKGPIRPSIHPSVHPSVCPGIYIVSLGFSNVWHGARNIVAEPDFLEKCFLPQKLGKWTKNGPKTIFLEFMEKFDH